jgi:hypothetical protein
MVELTFAVEGAVVDSYAAAPSLLFKLCVANETPDVRVENVLLHCQIRIEATRRTYAPEDRERLIELGLWLIRRPAPPDHDTVSPLANVSTTISNDLS